MLGERSEEKNLLYKQLFFRYAGRTQSIKKPKEHAGRAQRGENFAAQRKNTL